MERKKGAWYAGGRCCIVKAALRPCFGFGVVLFTLVHPDCGFVSVMGSLMECLSYCFVPLNATAGQRCRGTTMCDAVGAHILHKRGRKGLEMQLGLAL